MKFRNLLAAGAIVVLSSTTTLAISKFFSDVDKDGWYGPSVEKLSDLGIIKGYSDGTFKPDQKVSRAELAVMLDRTIQYLQTGKVEDTDKIPANTSYKQILMTTDGDADGKEYALVLYSTDAKENTGESCSKGYSSGNFKLSLTYDDKIIDNINLGMIEVPKTAGFKKSFDNGNGSDAIYIVEKYESCNNNSFAFYMTDIFNNGSGEITPVKFKGSEANEIYADSFEKITFMDDSFQYSSYNNATQKWTDKIYKWDGKKKEFQEYTPPIQ